MRRYLVFAIIGLSLLLYSSSFSAVSVAFPVLVSDFNTSVVLAGWVLNAFNLVSVTVMPLAGKVSEALGSRRTFMLCALLFTIGSVLCAIAPNIGLLIAARVIQGLGGGGFMPTATGIVIDHYPEARQRYIGLFSSIVPFGMVVGPNVGGLMVQSLGWRSVFWLSVPLSVTVLVLSWIYFQRDSKRRTITFDFKGAGLLFGGMLVFILALTEMGRGDSGFSGVSWPYVGTLFALSIALFIAFWRQEQRAIEPIVELEVLKGRPFKAANIYNMTWGFCVMGVNPLIPLYAVSIYGMTILESGVIITPRSVMMMVFSTITSFYLGKWGYRKPILTGTLLISFSLFLLSFEARGIRVLGPDISPLMLLLLVMGVSGLGAGIAAPASNNACLELMPHKAATIAGLRGMFRNLGGAIGVAVATVLLHTIGNAQQAFYVVMLSLALLMLMSIPSIFLLPRSAHDVNSRGRETVKAGGG
ncbi:MAG: MFS transporter [Chloroflexi bacterium]|nr:MFS transporter [Chloroflexota bacterium]